MKTKIKLLIVSISVLYLLSMFFGIRFFLGMNANQKSQLSNFVVISINMAKQGNKDYWKNVLIFSLGVILFCLCIWGLSNLHRYMQLLNIGIVVFKGFSFGLATAVFFYVYKIKGFAFFLSYILLKELIVFIFLIILILYSFIMLFFKNKMARIDKSSFAIIGMIIIFLMCGILVIDNMVAKLACRLI
ncbi:hypothetical protein B0S90_2094 [Caldicellulosiruptor bescii]|uniref:Uncharacterized protein n=2 Tax=Caldicellulosiruptor bescii TaxID=31899 RepID=B9MKM2_CALBD|nr:hypothetical protein [Caldicellulosiruptor bescii]ACM60880.1 conserved hypothetical protein [Caldicellulosiruptor bescii DSM 6725]PBC89302.1 hypothetical protein B0S87_2393 [Caldicellulosiruptor bescii]PBC91213.1 hypothetical protein B0S89_1595 [Caldicellulosiruptor bescii]PBD03373.1 hypothetical protein B0S85_0971 [Caldicellulosiruptor bescii]PBD07012.1 hypothetical protein B0S90_2094 [Caldicellulosiruptor bescii]